MANALASAYESLGRREEADALFGATARLLGEGREEGLDALYAEAAYHMACLRAYRGERAAALEWLRKSLGAGFQFPDALPANTDLESLRGPDLDALLARTRANRAPLRR